MESSNFLVPFPMAMQNEVEGTSEQVQDWLLNPNFDNSVDQNDPLESALSSMVSSPVASNAGENIVLRELIGRLGGICNSGEVSPHSYMNGKNSSNNSCYSTPLNSPPKLNLTMMDHHHQIRGNLENLPFPVSHTEPGFAGRATRYSCFANNGVNDLHGKSMDNVYGYQEEKSSLSDQIPGWKDGMIGQDDGNLRKRKSNSKGKSKDVVPSSTSSQEANVNMQATGEAAKRSKTDDNDNGKDKKSKRAKNGNKDDEPLKDYIHVRARRGQATDAHSLAERVRREKISQRMKFLQDLVPGCNKVTGKAVMLDEIINYVQSLQQQVEFLSMKLTTINPGMDVDIEALLSSKDMSQAHGPLLSGPLNSLSAFPFHFQCQQAQNLHAAIPNETSMPLLPTLIDAAMGRKHSMQVPLGSYSEAATQDSTIWEDDLQSVVFGQNQTHNLQSLIATPAQMKEEQCKCSALPRLKSIRGPK